MAAMIQAIHREPRKQSVCSQRLHSADKQSQTNHQSSLGSCQLNCLKTFTSTKEMIALQHAPFQPALICIYWLLFAQHVFYPPLLLLINVHVCSCAHGIHLLLLTPSAIPGFFTWVLRMQTQVLKLALWTLPPPQAKSLTFTFNLSNYRMLGKNNLAASGSHSCTLSMWYVPLQVLYVQGMWPCLILLHVLSTTHLKLEKCKLNAQVLTCYSKSPGHCCSRRQNWALPFVWKPSKLLPAIDFPAPSPTYTQIETKQFWGKPEPFH